jgi:hypothetical protein
MDDSDDDIQSSDNEIDSLVLAALLLATVYSQRRLRIPSNRLYTSQEYVDDLLNCGNDIRIRNQLRMKLMTFNMLRDWLVSVLLWRHPCIMESP